MVGKGFGKLAITSPTGDTPLPEDSSGAEAAFIVSWNKEIERAAYRVARFSHRAGADDADDVGQNIRIRLLEEYRRLDVAPPAPWVRRLIKYTAINAIRDDRRRLTQHHDSVALSFDDNDRYLASLGENPAQLPEALVSSPQPRDVILEAAVRKWVTSLPTQLRMLYRLLYVDDRKMSEVAFALGVTPARVSQLHRDLLTSGRKALPHLH
jgi:RNA polymerase sigma factor (sigma-70 family)